MILPLFTLLKIPIPQQMTILNLVFPTAIVSVIDSQNKLVQCPALLDCGSQHSFITEKLADALNLNKDDVNLNLSGIGARQKVFGKLRLYLEESCQLK